MASIADITEDATVRSFDRLVAEGLLNRLSGDRFEFAHSILREALYDDIGPGEQRRIHSLIADDLSRERDRGLRVDITELATHVAECANPGDVHAAAVLAEAGRLTARTAPLVSARWFSKCAELQPIGSAERTTALMLQASSMFRASRPSEAARLGREALDNMPAGPLRTRTLTDTVNSLYICGDPEAAIGVIDTEERRFGQLSAALQAQRATFQAQLGRNVVAERDHAATVTNPSVVELAITMTHDMHRAGMRGDTATVTVLIERLKRLGPAASVQTQLAIHGSIAIEAVFLCLLDEAADVLDRASRLRQGDHGLSIGGQVEIAGLMLAFEQGRWDESVARIPDLNWDLAHNQTRILEGCVQAVHCQILLERGELRAAREVASGFRWHIEAVRQLMDPVLGKLALAHGDVHSALTGLEAARCRVLDSGLHFGLDRILDTLIDACLADGDRASAVAHLVELDAQANRTGWTVSRLRADLARARVVFDVDAARAAKEAASVIGQPFEQARAALIAGQLNDDALSNLTAAYETFDQLGALRWRQLAAGELRTRHLAIPRPTVDRHDELSETESMLTHLVSQGLTNRQIANTLHYSIKTVEVYLTRLYAKTNCRTRLELARAVDRGDVVTAR